MDDVGLCDTVIWLVGTRVPPAVAATMVSPA